MSADTNMLEQHIKEENIKYYDYNEFTDIEEIGGGLVDKIYKAYWKLSGKFRILKSFSLDNNIVKEIINEVSFFLLLTLAV
jgi:hypothetical protein